MYPKDLRYTNDHEWVRPGDNGVYTVGITAYAAEQLGDVTYVELPKPGAEFTQGDEAAAVESVKAASDVFAPVGGKVSAVNPDLEGQPELVNRSPYENGWFFQLESVNAGDLDTLMDAAAYEQFVKEQEH